MRLRPLRLTSRLIAGLAAVAMFTSAAYAQEDPSATTSTTSTTSTTAPPPTTTTTAPPAAPVPPAPAPTPPPEQPPPEQPPADQPPPEQPPADQPPPPEDAESANDVPTEQVVIPPPLEPLPVNPVSDLVEKFVGVSLKNARTQVLQAESERFAAAAQVAGLEQSIATLEGELARLQGAQAEAVERFQHARLQLRRRAVASYTGQSTAPVESLLDVEDINDFGRWLQFAKAIVEADRGRVQEYAEAKRAVDGDLERTVATLDEQRTELAVAQATLLGADAALVAKQVQASSAQAGGIVAAAGFTFPVGGPHSYSDTFGAPRMFGTPFAHLHQGTDIFAASGTPLLACERGVITKMGSDRLGGTKLWIIGASGARYYYAHLTAFAPDTFDGKIVNPGDPVGYVGNTGNALTTPPHLHFEVHPNGGAAINPYPLLRAFDDAATTLTKK